MYLIKSFRSRSFEREQQTSFIQNKIGGIGWLSVIIALLMVVPVFIVLINS